MLARLRTLDGAKTLEPGRTVAVRLILDDPLLLVPSDRFIVRKFSPVVTIGGGEVVDAFPPAKVRAGTSNRCIGLAGASASERIGTLLSESSHGMSLHELAIRTGAPPAEVQGSLPPSALVAREPQILGPRSGMGAWQLVERWTRMLAHFHRANPLLPGIRREELRSRELPDAPPYVSIFFSDRRGNRVLR